MGKDEQTQVYILAYNKVPEYGLLDDKLHTPIQCGKALSKEKVCEVCDDEGDNISEKNPWFVETTGIYWIWKHDTHKYVGQHQYRRYLNLDAEKVPEILEKFDIITSKPLKTNVSLYDFYNYYHIISDLELCGEIIKEKYNEYEESWEKFVKNGTTLFYSNGFITTRENYDKLCSFVFGVLFEFEKRIGCKTKEDWVKHGSTAKNTANSHKNEISDAEYQSRVCGYLFERLATLFIMHNFKRIAVTDYILKEKGMSI